MNKLIVLSDAAPVSMADEWFEIADVNHFWMQWRFSVLLNKLKSSTVNFAHFKSLEIGCGHGQFLKQAEYQLNLAVDGCDLNEFALKKIQNAKGQIFLYNIFDRKPEMLNRYDCIYLLDVVEHLDDDAEFLRVASEHLKPGGLVVINVPALPSLYSKYDTVAGHKKRYKKNDIRKLFEACDIQPITISYWGFLLLPVAAIRKFVLLFAAKEKVIENGFKPPYSFVNSFFKKIMAIETSLSQSPPIGTSVIAIGKKK